MPGFRAWRGVSNWMRTTPGRLRLQSLLVAGAALVLLGTGSGGVVAVLVTETNIHQRTVREIVGVQRLHAWLAAADRSAANSYLSGGAELTLPQQQYEADVAAAGRELEQAGGYQSAADPVGQRLAAISQSFGDYTRLVDSAMVQHRLGSSDGMVDLRAASDLMHNVKNGILAEVEEVERMCAAELTQADLTLTIASGVLAAFALSAVVAVGLLVWTQRYVRWRFRRRRNKRLLAATLAAVVVATGTGTGVYGARQSIVQSQAQYARLLNLWHARSLAYDANGDTSLYLIAASPAGATTDTAFQADTSKLVDRPLTDDLLVAAQRGQVRFAGMLANELQSAGSAAERDAALRVIRAYRQFLDIDSKVHAKAAAGHQADAVMLTLGTYGAPLGLAFKTLDWGPRLGAQRDWSEGELGFAFEEFDWDLAQLTQLLQTEFDATMTAVERLLTETLVLQALSLSVAALTFAGLRPRIAEYLV
jgi:hypothetical protein